MTATPTPHPNASIDATPTALYIDIGIVKQEAVHNNSIVSISMQPQEQQILSALPTNLYDTEQM